MSDIQQSYSLDASQAIGSLTTLDQSVQRVSASINTLKRTSSGTVSTPFDSMAAGAGKANHAVGQARDALGRFASTGSSSIQQVTVSWETMTRVVQTQLIVRALNQVIDAFFRASEAAAEFQLQASRITAISDLDLGGAQDAVQDLAREVGRGVAESGEALFEALQNDLGTTEQTLELLRGQASELALLTGGTLPEAVNSLSSVIKSYNLDLSESTSITSVLFGAIDAGRITLADLESSLGTVLPLSRQVGVGFEEVAAAMGTITRGGTTARVATTQLRNVFNKAIKPTQRLTEVYEELGVTGFRQLVQESGGFIQALQAITDNLGNNETEIARAFNTIRGSLGVFSLLKDEGQEYATVMEVIENKAKDVATAVETIEGTDARKLERALTDLDVVMTDVGQAALSLKANFLDLFTDIISDGHDAATAFVGLAAGGTTAAVSVFGLEKAIKALQFAFFRIGPAAAVTGTVLAGIWAVNAVQRYDESMKGIQDRAEKVGKSGAEAARRMIGEAETKRVKELDEALGDTDNRLNKLMKSGRTAAREIEVAFSEAASGVQGAFAAATDTATGSLKSLLDDARKELDGLDSKISDLRKQQRGEAQTLEDFDFEESIRGLGDVEKANRALFRAQDTRLKQMEEIEKIRKGGGNIEEARRLSKLAETQGKQARSLAESADNAGLLNRAIANQRGVLENNEALTETYIDSLEGIDRAGADKAVLDVSRGITQLNSDVELARDLFQQLGEARRSGGQTELIDSLQSQLDGLLERIRTQGAELFGSQLFKDFGSEDAAKIAAENFERRLSNIQVDWSKAVGDLEEQLSSQEITVGVRIILDELAGAQTDGLRDALQGARTENPVRSAEQQVDAAREYNKEQGKLGTEIRKNQSTIREATRDFNTFYDQARTGARGFTDTMRTSIGSLFDRDFIGKQDDAVNSLLDPVASSISNLGDMATPELLDLQQQILGSLREATTKGLLPTTESDVVGALEAGLTQVRAQLKQIGLEEQFDAAALQESNELLDGLAEKRTVDVDFSTIDQVSQKSSIARGRVGEIGQSARGASTQIRSLAGSTNALVGPANAAAAAFRAMEQAARAAAAAAAAAGGGGGGGGTNANFGGSMRYLANGGTRGRDTQAAMLDPDEFVVNARSSRNFFSELQALNAGRSPNQQSDGGVTNINIGDVNVNSPSQAAASQARDIGNSLRREIRRRTLRL